MSPRSLPLLLLATSLSCTSGCARDPAPASEGDLDGAVGDGTRPTRDATGGFTADGGMAAEGGLDRPDAAPRPDIGPGVADVGGDVPSVPQGCCVDHEGCGEGEVCVGASAGAPGQCAATPGPRGCFPSTCSGLYRCLGASTCGCGDGCVPEAGHACVPVEGACCEADADCPAGGVCSADGGGTCVRAPTNNECWRPEDCAEGDECQGVDVCGCEGDCAWRDGVGHCVTAGEVDLAECVDRFTGCGCDLADQECLDGFGSTTFYPAEAGPFPGGVSEPPELLEVAVARYSCSVCACRETWAIQVDGGGMRAWTPTDVVGFCRHLLEEDRRCSGCLEEWSGGAG